MALFKGLQGSCSYFLIKTQIFEVSVGEKSVILQTSLCKKVQLELYIQLYLKLAGSLKDSLDVCVCEVGPAGVGVVQEH